jgi:hypothetical protein
VQLAVAQRHRDRIEDLEERIPSGSWYVLGPSPTGPWNIADARPFEDEPKLFAAPIAQSFGSRNISSASHRPAGHATQGPFWGSCDISVGAVHSSASGLSCPRHKPLTPTHGNVRRAILGPSIGSLYRNFSGKSGHRSGFGGSRDADSLNGWRA